MARIKSPTSLYNNSKKNQRGIMQEKIKIYAAWVIVGFGGVFAVFLFFKYLFAILLPFVIGWAAALAVRRPAAFLHSRLRVHEGALRLVLAVGAVGAVGALLFFGTKALVEELSRLSENVGTTADLMQKISHAVSKLPLVSDLAGSGEGLIAGVGSMLMRVLPSMISSLATALPALLLSVGVGAIAAVYFCLDLDRVHTALLRIMPKRWHESLHLAKQNALRAALTVLRANFLLMLIAFVFMLVGFLFLGMPYPLLLSGLFALFDFLPVIGVGTFLVPWGVWLLFGGSVGKGIGLLVLFGVITAVRQLAEPHFIGLGYGMHPLLTLLSMYTGARFAGAIGMLLATTVALIIYGLLFPPSEGAASKKKKAAFGKL